MPPSKYNSSFTNEEKTDTVDGIGFKYENFYNFTSSDKSYLAFNKGTNAYIMNTDAFEHNIKSIKLNYKDYYSGLIYEMLGIPEDLYTPMFVCARVVGWLAHNIENKLYCDRIVRPAGKYVGKKASYIKMEDRK